MRGGEGRGALDGGYDAFVFEHHEVLYQNVPHIRRQRAVLLEQKRRQMRRKLGRLLRVTLRDLHPVHQYPFHSLYHYKRQKSYLRDKRDQLPEMAGLLVRADLENLARRVVVVPLLQELFFVRRGIAFDEVLQLRQVRGAEDAARHGWMRAVAKAKAGGDSLAQEAKLTKISTLRGDEIHAL